MSYLTVTAIQAWLEKTKLTISSVESDLEQHLVNIVLNKIAAKYDVSGWTDSSNTPELVLTILSMKYASQYYRRAYSEEPGDNKYARALNMDADELLDGIVSGDMQLIDVVEEPINGPSFYPTDVSSIDDPAAFSMGRIW